MRQTSFGPHREWAGQLIALYHGELAAKNRAAVESHLAGCQRCAKAYTIYQEVAGAMLKLPQATQDTPALEYQQQAPQHKVAETLLSQGNEDEYGKNQQTDASQIATTYSSGYRRRSEKLGRATNRRK